MRKESDMPMRGHQHHWKVVVIASAMVLGTPGRTQTPLCTVDTLAPSTWSPGGSRANAPYNATVKTTFDQKLPGGNSIHGVSISHQARDSAGRTRSETLQGCSFGENGRRHERLTVRVNDPIAGTNTNWNAGYAGESKVAQVFHFDQPQPAMKSTAEELAKRQKAFEAAMSFFQKEDKSEDLGVKQIGGLTARGSRTTRTVPAGEEGNDQPLMVVNETWRSAEYDLLLYAMQDDPRHGRTTMELEELNLAEPDRGLFLPPADYTIQDRPAIIQ
jgi:hypothetical protein